MYRGHCRSRAYSKEAFAKPRMENSVLYMAMATPADSTVACLGRLCDLLLTFPSSSILSHTK